MAIKAFAHKALEDLFRSGRTRRIGRDYVKRLTLLLDALDGATCALDLQGASGFHALRGDRARTYAMKVSGNWRLTFRFENGDTGDILDVDFEDYH